jgi:hypothetical protein
MVTCYGNGETWRVYIEIPDPPKGLGIVHMHWQTVEGYSDRPEQETKQKLRSFAIVGNKLRKKLVEVKYPKSA